jgi:penicillin-binding protein 1A
MSFPLRRVRIANRHPGGLWWRIPSVLLLWSMFAVPVIAGLAALIVLRDYNRGLPYAPNLDAWERTLPRTSVIVAHDGSLLAEIPFNMNDEIGHRFPVAFADIPETMVSAILAAEDVRFFTHSGVDVQAVARAAWSNYKAGRIVEGASTITQQVARNLLPDEIGFERSLRRIVREALLARRIERRYPKARIFEVFANHAFLGANA